MDWFSKQEVAKAVDKLEANLRRKTEDKVTRINLAAMKKHLLALRNRGD